MSEIRRPQLHVSALNMLSKCGEQYRRRYIEGEKIPPGIAAIVGTATDASMTRNLDSKIVTGNLISLEEAQTVAAETLVKEWDKGVMLDEEQRMSDLKVIKKDAIDKSVRLSKLHHGEVAPRLRPTYVQRTWTLELEGYPVDLAGAIDIQEDIPLEGGRRNIIVRDTKTSGKSPSQGIAETSEQLTMYALAVNTLDGQMPESLVLDYLIDTKVPKSVTITTHRTIEDFTPLMHRIEAAVSATEKGTFIPARQDDWWCSEKWCGFHRTCPYVRHPISVTVPISIPK